MLFLLLRSDLEVGPDFVTALWHSLQYCAKGREVFWYWLKAITATTFSIAGSVHEVGGQIRTPHRHGQTESQTQTQTRTD